MNKNFAQKTLNTLESVNGFVFKVTSKLGFALDLSTTKVYQKVEAKLVEEIKENNPSKDYYNGSENDLENLLLEIKKISLQKWCVCDFSFLQKRLNFLSEEGFQLLDFYKEKPKSFKVRKNDLEKLISGSKKTIKKKPTKKKN